MHRVLLIVMWSLVVSAPLVATEVVPLSFAEAVGEAELVVNGTVTDVRAVRTAGVIESVATVAVDVVLKGDATGFVAVRIPGGTLGRTRQVMVGAPTLRPGQRAVFFLTRGRDFGWRPVGLSWGVARVEYDAATRRAVVRSPLLAADAPGARRIVRGAARGPVAASEFEALVRVVAEAQRRATRRAR